MTDVRRRLRLLESRTGRRRPSADRAVGAALARLSVSELGTLESALVARQQGRPLDDARRAAFHAWERVAVATAP
jgi:hypothetical protein